MLVNVGFFMILNYISRGLVLLFLLIGPGIILHKLLEHAPDPIKNSAIFIYVLVVLTILGWMVTSLNLI